MNTRLSLVLSILALFTACHAPAPAPAPETVDAAPSEPLVVFLVRHSEKANTGGHDPALTPEGEARSALLATMLASSGIEAIHSSNYLRTRDTAAPVAAQLGLEVQIYDPSDLWAVATMLREAGGRHLVVGHSNTTPQLTELLGGDPGTPIQSPEYDRLYVVTTDGESTSTVLLRFGEAFEGAGAK